VLRGKVAGGLALLLAAGYMSAPAPMYAGGPFATEFTQILNYGQLLASDIKLAAQLKTNLQSYAQQMVDGKVLPTQVWGPIASDLVQLANVVKGGRSLAYSMANLDVQFQRAYPGYMQQGVPFYQQYANWNQTSWDTISSSLRSLNVQSNQLNNEQGLLGVLHNLASNAVGQDQAIQVGTLIADQQVQQLEKLRQIMLVNVQTMAAAEGRKIQTDAAQKQAQASAFDDMNVYPTN
jgi:P-type conjugative transfer protein TrbJ